MSKDNKEIEEALRAFGKFLQENPGLELEDILPKDFDETGEYSMFDVMTKEIGDIAEGFGDLLGDDGIDWEALERMEELLGQADLAGSAEEYREIIKEVLRIDSSELDLAATAVDPNDWGSTEALEIIKAYGDRQLPIEARRGWIDFDERPYIRLVNQLIIEYRSMGMYPRAIELAEEVMSYDNYDGLGIRYSLMTLYAIVGNLEKSKALWEQFEEPVADPNMAIPFIVTAISHRDYQLALDTMKPLANYSDGIGQFFDSNESFPIEEIYEAEQLLSYEPGSLDNVLIAFARLYPFLVQGDYLFKVMKLIYQAAKANQQSFELRPHLNRFGIEEFYLEEDEQSQRPHPNVIPFPGTDLNQSKPVDDLRIMDLPMNVYRSLKQAGIKTRKELEAMTEAEVLAIKGIGPASLKRIKENGINFAE